MEVICNILNELKGIYCKSQKIQASQQNKLGLFFGLIILNWYKFSWPLHFCYSLFWDKLDLKQSLDPFSLVNFWISWLHNTVKSHYCPPLYISPPPPQIWNPINIPNVNPPYLSLPSEYKPTWINFGLGISVNSIVVEIWFLLQQEITDILNEIFCQSCIIYNASPFCFAALNQSIYLSVYLSIYLSIRSDGPSFLKAVSSAETVLSKPLIVKLRLKQRLYWVV